jgi:hypothetical protein
MLEITIACLSVVAWGAACVYYWQVYSTHHVLGSGYFALGILMKFIQGGTIAFQRMLGVDFMGPIDALLSILVPATFAMGAIRIYRDLNLRWADRSSLRDLRAMHERMVDEESRRWQTQMKD